MQAKLREVKTSVRVHDRLKKNPLKNRTMMQKLNPFSRTARANELVAAEARQAARAAALKHKHSKAGRAEKAKRTARHNALSDRLEASFKAANEIILEEARQGRIEESDEGGEESD